jgi:hypothetical protein
MVGVMARCDRCGCIGSDSAVGCGGCEVNIPGSVTSVELGNPLPFGDDTDLLLVRMALALVIGW